MEMIITKSSNSRGSNELTDEELEFEVKNRLTIIDEVLERYLDSEKTPPIAAHRLYSDAEKNN